MRNLEIKNIKSHPSLSLANANALRDLQINFNQAEDALTIPAESRHDYKCGFATQSGRSMIEMLGVLAIIGVLSVGGIAGYSKAMHKYRINKTIEQITLVAGNVRTFFAPQSNYKDLNIQNINYGDYLNLLQKAKLIPDEMWVEGSPESALGGSFDLYCIDKSTQDDYKAFSIVTIVSEEDCIELASQDWSALNIKAISMCDGNGPETCPTLKTPIELSDVIASCTLASGDNSASGKGNTSMSFYFDININSSKWPNSMFSN